MLNGVREFQVFLEGLEGPFMKFSKEFQHISFKFFKEQYCILRSLYIFIFTFVLLLVLPYGMTVKRSTLILYRSPIIFSITLFNFIQIFTANSADYRGFQFVCKI